MSTRKRLLQALGITTFLVLIFCSVSVYRWFTPSVSYGKLEFMLNAGNWEKANVETTRLLLRLSRRDYIGLYPVSWKLYDFYEVPCEDYLIIDRLWSQHSNNKFGLIIQADIWQDLTHDNDLVDSHYRDYSSIDGLEALRAVDTVREKARYSPIVDPANSSLGRLPSTGWMFEGTLDGHDPLSTTHSTRVYQIAKLKKQFKEMSLPPLQATDPI